MYSIKNIVKNICPPFLFNLLKSIFSRQNKFYGHYNNWYDANAVCDKGYDSNKILQKVLESSLKVKNGEAIFERDSVLFDEIKYSWPVTTSLMLAAALNTGNLNVLDFGGALGSHYNQNIKLLKLISDVKWNIVEQENLVKLGKIHFQSNNIKFYLTIPDCLIYNKPNLVLLSSVLQYLPEPWQTLKEIIKINAKIVVLDRTPFASNQIEEVKIQVVPDHIYNARYPCRFFNETKMLEIFKIAGYSLLETFNSIDKFEDFPPWKGHIFIKNSNIIE